MYSELNSRINKVRYDIQKAYEIRVMINQLEAEKEACTKTQQELFQRLQKEKRDVEKLDDMSIQKVAYTVISRLSERKGKERKEYLDVKLKYDRASQDLIQTECKIAALRRELTQYEDSEKEYENLYDEKKAHMIAKSLSAATQILYKTENVNAVLRQMLEIRAAMDIGKQVLGALEKADMLLESADVCASGGETRDSYLEEVQIIIENTSELLPQFNLDLTCVGIDSDIQMEIVDFNLDSLFTMFFGSMRKEHKMCDASAIIQSVRRSVKETMQQLEELLELSVESLKNEQSSLDRYILET